MTSTIVDLRAKAKKELAEWYNEKVVQPFIAKGRELGLSDDEINVAFNIAIQPTLAWNEGGRDG
jgi:hypothetical protein